MGGSPDGEVADELAVDVRGECAMPGHPVEGARAPGFVGDALLQVVDPLGEPVEVVARARVLPERRWDIRQPGQGGVPVGGRGGARDPPGEGGGGVVGLGERSGAALPARLFDHLLRWCAVDPAQRELAPQVRVGRLLGEAWDPPLEGVVQRGHALVSEVLLGQDR